MKRMILLVVACLVFALAVMGCRIDVSRQQESGAQESGAIAD